MSGKVLSTAFLVKKLHIMPENGKVPDTIVLPCLLNLKKESNFLIAAVRDYSKSVKKKLESQHNVKVEFSGCT